MHGVNACARAGEHFPYHINKLRQHALCILVTSTMACEYQVELPREMPRTRSTASAHWTLVGLPPCRSHFDQLGLVARVCFSTSPRVGTLDRRSLLRETPTSVPSTFPPPPSRRSLPRPPPGAAESLGRTPTSHYACHCLEKARRSRGLILSSQCESTT